MSREDGPAGVDVGHKPHRTDQPITKSHAVLLIAARYLAAPVRRLNPRNDGPKEIVGYPSISLVPTAWMALPP